ncbi:MAG: helix-turn-helix domain-containing protein [Leucobacter sp.]
MRSIHTHASETELRLGEKLRAARKAQRITIDQLATATGLSKGFISRVENNSTSLSIASLVQICQVLSISVGELFTEAQTMLVPLDQAPFINLGGEGVTERLVSGREESRVQMIRSTAEPHAHGGQALYTISSELEILHVVHGSVTVMFPSHNVEMREGDTLSFAGREPHTWRAHEKGAELVWTLIPAAWSGSA